MGVSGGRLRCWETILIGSLLLCSGWLPGDAFAEDSTGAETRVVANYRIDLGNFNLGSFRFTTLLNGSDYRVQGNGHFSILGGLLYDLGMTTASSGKVTSAGPEPATYRLSYAAGSDSGQLSISFDAGAVTALSIVPKQIRDPREIPVTKDSSWVRSTRLPRHFFVPVLTIRMAILKSVTKQCRCSTEGGGMTLCYRQSGELRCKGKARRPTRAMRLFAGSSSSQSLGMHPTIPTSR